MKAPLCSILCALLAGCGAGGLPGPRDLTLPDADNDGIMDHHEGVDGEDADFDGEPNRLDIDSDGDGISDATEAGDDDLASPPVDTDQDGTPDFLDLDSDDNCIDDGAEGVPGFADLDNDRDGLLDRVEIGPLCANPDTDGDGTPDFEDEDSDGDGIPDAIEGRPSPFDDLPVDTDGDRAPDYRDLDSDGDGTPDAEEGYEDLDSDGLGNYADTDSDGDGLHDRDERGRYGTDPFSDDSDGDGFSDGAEVDLGADPLDPESGIEGIYVEVPARTDVQAPFQFELSVERGDVVFLLDTTGSMGSTVSAMSNEFSQIVSQLTTALPDAEYGVATFDDYNYSGIITTGAGLDRPFILQQQVTSDTGRVQDVLRDVSLHNGADTPESGVEALLQALTGRGYDQDCDGTFDAATDVRPFVASPTDAFAGAEPGLRDSSQPGGGARGGLGFRPNALPIVVYATDAPMREPSVHVTPGGCPSDATRDQVVNAASDETAKLVGIHVNGTGARSQMEALADATGSLADLDGDGASDDRLVFAWSGSNAQFRETIVRAVEDLVDTVVFQEITLEVVGDDLGFVVDIDPPVHTLSGAANGTLLDLTLTFRGMDAPSDVDRLHRLTLQVLGDGSVLLDSLDITVLVPGTTL